MTAQVHSEAWRRDAGVIGLVSFCHASSHFSHLLLPLMFPFFVSELGLGYAALGGVISVFFAVSFVAQTSSGFVVDRYGARRVLYAGQALMVLACLWLAGAGNMADLVLGAILLGIGNGVHHPVDYSVLNRQISPLRLGHAYSMHNVSGTLGWALAPPFMVGLSSLWHWPAAYIGAAMVYAGLLVLCVWRSPWLESRQPVPAPIATGSNSPAPKRSMTLMDLLRQPAVVWSFAFLFCMTMTYSVVQNFLIIILQKVHGLGLTQASLALSAYLITAALGNFAGGFVTTRWPERVDHIVGACMAAAAALMLLSATALLGAWGTPAALILTALAVGLGAPARDMMIKQATPAGATGRVYGLVFAGLDMGSAASPLIFGVLMDRGWYGLTLAGAALFLMGGGLVSIALSRSLRAASSQRSSGVNA
ncbi:MAG: MFS transporter [Alphaproteobacteria bacterium]|nr:MFS transporter [Alphaproteobacteria bacterium]